MSNIRVASLKEPVDVGEYLFRRIHQLGIRSVHGVPGDYNLGWPCFLSSTYMRANRRPKRSSTTFRRMVCTGWGTAMSSMPPMPPMDMHESRSVPYQML
jgi:hypothetical protein